MSKFLINTAAMIAAISFFAPAPASASHKSPLYVAADDYRDAVKDFERAVLRSRYIERFQERVVDDLEDSTSDLRSAARRPENLGRLLAQWREVQLLHRNVESVIFSNPACPSRPELIGPWERVTCAFTELALQIDSVQCVDPIHTSSFRYSIDSAPYCPVQGYRVPVRGVPVYRAPLNLNTLPNYQTPVNPLPNYQAPTNPAPHYGTPSSSYGTPSSSYGTPSPEYGNPSTEYGNPAPSIPNYRVPDSQTPGLQVPERVLPETLPPPSRVPADVQPSSWNSNRRSPAYVPSSRSPYRNSSQSFPSRSYDVQSEWMQASGAARTLQRTVSYQGVNATTIASLIARLMD